MNKPYKVLGISGSLREASLNSLYLRALALTCPAHIDFTIYEHLADIPAFNEDLNGEDIPAVSAFRQAIADTDMTVIATPEYARGVSGVLKNALDWLVSEARVSKKPVALPNVAVRPTIAPAQLAEILTTMDLIVLKNCSPQATMDKPLINPNLTATKIAEDDALGERLHAFWALVVEGLNKLA